MELEIPMLTTATIVLLILKIAGIIPSISWFFVFLPLAIELVAVAIRLVPILIKLQSNKQIQTLIKRNEKYPKSR